MTKIIELTKGFLCLIDEEDFELVSKWNWTFSGGYARRQNRGKTYSMHRQILGLTGSSRPFVDHINGDGLDNRKSNLRVCSQSENQGNQGIPKNNTTGYKGVGLCNRSSRLPFRAYISVKDKHVNLGRFETIELAVNAYNSAAKSYFREFAVLNKIRDSKILIRKSK